MKNFTDLALVNLHIKKPLFAVIDEFVNPIVGFSKLKDYIQLMFWSGADFDEEKLQLGSGKFKDASIRFTKLEQIDTEELARWLKKARTIQWDYKNIVKRKGKLERIQ